MHSQDTTPPANFAHSDLKHREISALRAAAKKRQCGGVYDTYEMAKTIDRDRGRSGRLLKSELIEGLVSRFHIHPETPRKRVTKLTRDSRFTRSVHCGVIYLRGLVHVHQELGAPYLGRAIDVPIQMCQSVVARRAESYAGVIHLEERLAVNYTRPDREPVRQIRLLAMGRSMSLPRARGLTHYHSPR